MEISEKLQQLAFIFLDKSLKDAEIEYTNDIGIFGYYNDILYFRLSILNSGEAYIAVKEELYDAIKSVFNIDHFGAAKIFGMYFKKTFNLKFESFRFAANL